MSGGSGQAGAGEAGQGGAGEGGAGEGGAGQGGAGASGAGQAGVGGAGAAGVGGSDAGGAGSAGGPVSPDKCPGEAVTLGAGTTTLQGNTTGLTNDTNSGDQDCGGSNSSDAVYAMKAEVAGRVTLVLEGTGFTPTVYVRQNCTGQGSAYCGGNGGATAQTTFLVTAGASFFVFVDGRGTSNQSGPYTLKATLEPPVCGNGAIEVGEQCDDGNTAPGDGCDAACKVEPDCSLADVPDSSFSNPLDLPDGCSTINVSGGRITSSGGNVDNDWYCVEVDGGQTLTVQTYVGAPGFCYGGSNNNTFVEIYREQPDQAPNGNLCQTSGALACNDDQEGGAQAACSKASYKVPGDQGGEYCVRVTRGVYPDGNNIEYGLTVTIQ